MTDTQYTDNISGEKYSLEELRAEQDAFILQMVDEEAKIEAVTDVRRVHQILNLLRPGESVTIVDTEASICTYSRVR